MAVTNQRQMIFTTKLVDEATDMINDGIVVKRYQNPWLKSEVGLRRAGVTFKMTSDEQQEYVKCALDIHYFVEKYCKVKREDGSVGNIKLRDYQKEILDNFVTNRFNILMASRQVGKAQDLDSIVWDINGKKRFGDLKLGDQIYGDDGELTCVTGIYPQGIKDIYEIEFSDGTTARSCDEHLWTVIDYMGYEKTLQLKDIMNSFKSKRGDYKYYVKMNEPVNYPEKDLEIDPYLLGIILGDGSITQKVVKVSNTDKEVIDYLYTLEDDDIKISRVGETCDYNISRTSPKIRNKYKLILEELNLMGKSSSDKFIPKEYLTGSITQRISLLQGLMDTDGGAYRNRPEYNTVSKQLSEDFRELCHSLGIKTSVVKKKRYYTYKGERKRGKDCYKVRLYLRNGYKYPIFRIKRKQELIKDKKFDWGYKRGIESIKYIGKKEAQCIEVDNDTRLYLTDNYIPTHNTISAAIFMLHKILFDNDKNIMIVANKGDTAVEIVDKIKSIYTLLPFFLKPGIKTWNQKSLTFENGCRIKTSARTKTPAIGFTIDVLYLDEFAHIPSNIIEPYYTAAFPTTAAVQNSKIIITSTPNGMNLFHKLLTDAERPDGDPQKNNYKPMRVYWYQVPGRFVTYLRLNPHRLHEYEITKEEILEEVENKWGGVTTIKMGWNSDMQKDIIHVDNNDECKDEDVKKFVIERNGKEIPIVALAESTTWKDEAIKDIGGEDAFNQEYGLRFINASKSLLNEAIIQDLLDNKINYKWEEILEFENKLKFSYKDLKWIDDDEIWRPIDRKNYKIVISVDISEGLGQDYSVINIFKLNNKSKKIIDSQKASYKSIVDFFKLDQIGIFRNNFVSVKQLAELLYLIAFEYFNPENVRIVLELNNYGNTLLAEMPNLFDGNNDYGSSIFVRYKHRADSNEEKVGLKVGNNKNLLVKDYQDLITSKSFFINNEDTIREITTFVKHTTTAGNVKYAADVGHDDCLLPNTMIKTINGYRKIKDIKLGDMVLTHLGNYKKVTNICVKDFDGDMYKVKFKGQVELDITYNHPIYIASENYSRKKLKPGNYNKYEKRNWLLPDQIKKKHRCVVIEDKIEDKESNYTIKWQDLFIKDKNFSEKNIKVKEIEFDDNLSKFVGLFLADGNCYKPNNTTYRLSIAFNKNQIDLINEVKNWLTNWNLKFHEKIGKGNSYTILFNNKTFYELMSGCYDKETKEKILPTWYKELNLKYVLDYWLKGDGWVSNRKGRSSKTIGCTTSLQLALSMRDIALSIGRHSVINKYKRKRYEVVNKNQYWVTIYQKRPNSSSLKKSSDFEYTSVIDNIERYNYKGITYNLEVEDDNSYIANGIVVHNCVMTIVNATSIFPKNEFSEMCEDWLNSFVDKEIANYINECLKQVDYVEGVDYGQVLKVRRQYMSRNKGEGYNQGSWFGLQ